MKIAPLIGFPGRKLTQTTIKENLQDENVQLETLLAIEQRFRPDIIFTFMDLSVEAQAINLHVEFPEDDSPNVVEYPVGDNICLKKYETLDFETIFESSRMKLFANLVRKFKKASETKLSAYVIGPFSLAGLMAGATELMLSVVCEQQFLSCLLDFTNSLVIQYAQRLIDAGADYITILEPTAVMLSPKQFQDFVSPRISKLSSELSVPSILHICGDTTHLFSEFRKLKSIFGLSLDSDVDLRLAYERTRKTVIGNVNPVIIARASKQRIYREISALVRKMEGISDFVLSSGCDLPPETPLDNISLFWRIFSKFDSQKLSCASFSQVDVKC